jgi:hypothetical protein
VASVNGIAATSDGLRTVLERAAAASPFAALRVDHFGPKQLQVPPGDGEVVVSLWLYRVSASSIRRSSTQLVTLDGETLNAPVAVDLYYLVTGWAKSPLLQQQLLGWAIRVLDDTPVLPASLLNDGPWAGVFRPAETVEVAWQPLTMQEEFDVWQVAQGSQLPSASYLVRGLELESRTSVEELPLVQTREWDYADEVPS